MGKKIEINCEGASTLPWKQLEVIQGELKSLSSVNNKRLKDRIIKNGFTDPIRVWRGTGKYKNKNCILDGTQRFRVISELNSEGYSIPDLPVSWIIADNYEGAKKILLSMASQYGKIEKQGLYEFMAETTIPVSDIDSFHFPEFKFEKFKMEYFDETQEKKIDNITEYDKQYIVAIDCSSEEQFNKICGKLKGLKIDFKSII